MKNNLKNETYIIGEIGQNHNGSVDIAKLIIDLASRPITEDTFGLNLKPINAIKLQKRDLSTELTDSQMNRIYDNNNSFGKTYGEHRAYLELSNEEHFEVYKYAKKSGLDFIETLCSPSCLSILDYFTPDYLKVASRDLTNLPLIEALAETKIPIILSTGMSGEKDLDIALSIISKYHNDISILHCVSQYPTEPNNLNLNSIKFLQTKYEDYPIGFSDHTIGIAAPMVAIGLGAKIIEKHITIDRDMKGTDQKCSLSPDGVRRMVRDIRLSEIWLGDINMNKGKYINAAKDKLERSIATNKEMKKGAIITDSDIILLSPGNGIKWKDRTNLIGKKINCNIPKNELILESYCE